jgi:16S rRNA processing protein RimM
VSDRPPEDPRPRDESGTPERITVGRINSTWGLKGHVKVTPFTSNEERLVSGAELIVAGQRRIALEVVRPQGYPIIRFEGYPDRTAAEALRGELIEIDAGDLPALPDGAYYVDDLRGLSVVTTSDEPIGVIADVLTTGANDVYVVKRSGQKDALIPAIGDVVQSVDLETRQMTIEPLPGLLDG